MNVRTGLVLGVIAVGLLLLAHWLYPARPGLDNSAPALADVRGDRTVAQHVAGADSSATENTAVVKPTVVETRADAAPAPVASAAATTIRPEAPVGRGQANDEAVPAVSKPQDSQKSYTNAQALTRGFAFAGDKYVTGGKTIELLRSAKRIAITCSKGADLEAVAKAAKAAGFGVGETHARLNIIVLDLPAGAAVIGNPIASAYQIPSVAYVDWVYAAPQDLSPVIISTSINVRFQPDRTDDWVRDYAAKIGLSAVRAIRGARNTYNVELSKADSSTSVLAFTAAHGVDEGVVWMEPNFIAQSPKLALPTDPLYRLQWHLHGHSIIGGISNANVHADQAWDYTRGTSSVVVAVMDDSIDWTHPDLTNNIFYNPGECGGGKEHNGLDDDGNGYVDDWHGWDFSDFDNDPAPFEDDDNHGTACAGCVASTADNGVGGCGVAPGCKILPIRLWLVTMAPDSDYAEAFYYATNFASVISCSWYRPVPSSVLSDSISEAWYKGRGGKGCLVYFAAGNFAPTQPWVTYPANLPTTLAIGGTGEDDTIVYYSCYGPELDFMAPTWGGSAGIWTTDRQGLWYGYNDNGVSWTYVSTYVSGGIHTCRWEYVKDEYDSSGWDCGWIDDVTIPGVGAESFESGTLTAWPWKLEGGGEWKAERYNAYSGDWSARSGKISDSSSNALVLVTNMAPGFITFRWMVSSEMDYDWLDFYVDGVLVDSYSGDGGDADGNFTDSFNGTSAACPIAAGVGALLLSQYPELSSEMARTILRATCDKVGATPYVDGRNDYYGYGRLNAWRAITGPAITSTPSTVAVVGQAYAYDDNYAAEAFGLGTILWQKVSGPSWFAINQTNGVISGTPSADYNGAVTIRAYSAYGTNTQTWTLHTRKVYYVNDSSTANDMWCTAVGSDSYAGTSSSAPKASVQSVLSTYTLSPADLVRIDTGTYNLSANIDVASTHHGTLGAPIEFNASPYGVVMNRGSTSSGNYSWKINTDNVLLKTVEGTNRAGVQRVPMRLTGGDGGIQAVSNNVTISWVDCHTNKNYAINIAGANALVRNCITRMANYGITVAQPGARILNCTVYSNKIYGIWCRTNDISIRNTIVYAQGASVVGVRLDGGASITNSDYNNLYAIPGAYLGYAGGNRTSLADWYGATLSDSNSVSADPLFANAGGGDLHLMSIEGRYGSGGTWVKDASHSPSIDAGDPLYVISKEPSPNGGRLNQGAYGDTSFASKSSTNVPTVTLDVYSAFGMADPPVGNHVYASNSLVHCSITNSFINGTTQVAVKGWTGTACVPATGTGTEVSFRLGTNSTITWVWTTNFWLTLNVAASGTTDVPSGWYETGTVQVVTATPFSGGSFTGWSGDTNGCTVNSNLISVPMSRPRSITASFTDGASPHGVPASWFSQHGLTNNPPAVEELIDRDGDGALSWEEYVAGTDPTNPASRFCVSNIVPQSAGSGYVLQWLSASGRLYSVLRASNLLYGAFSNLATNLPAQAPFNVYTDNTSSVTNFYYRIKVRY